MNLLEKCKNCKLKECIECEYTWSDLKETIEEFEKDYISKEKIMKYKKEAENAECKNTLEAVCIGAIIGVLDGLLGV